MVIIAVNELMLTQNRLDDKMELTKGNAWNFFGLKCLLLNKQ